MNLNEIRLDAKNALRESKRPALYDTLIYVGITAMLPLVLSFLYYLLDAAVEGTGGGLSASKLRAGYDMASSALYVVSTVASVCTMFFTFGYNATMLLRVRRRQVDSGSILIGFRLLLRVFALTVLMALYIMLWSLLFVIPGLIAAYRYRLAVFILLDDPSMLPSQALRASSNLVRGHKAKLLALDLSFWYYYVLCAAAAMLTNIDAYNVLAGFYELTALPSLSYEQTLVVYAAGILLLCAVQLWKLPHVTASTAGFYHRLRLDAIANEAPPDPL